MRTWIKYEVELTTRTPFRIGGVKPIPGTTDVDSPVVRIGDNATVQGTSLKGALRGELETYVIDHFFDKNSSKWKSEWMKPCIPADEKTMSSDEKKLIQKGLYKYSCSYPNPSDYICPICYLLGARGLVGFTQVPFLKLVKGDVQLLQFIREDRVTGTSAKGEKGAIGKFEIIPEGSTFKGTMAILAEDDIIGWKLAQARQLSESVGDKWLGDKSWTQDRILKDLVEDRLAKIEKLGGHRSKGCGDIQISVRRK